MKKVAIVGGGPAAIFLALFLDKSKFQVTIYEQNKALGRKFLVAGKGGFNLSHSEDSTIFKERYHPIDFISPSLDSFSNTDLKKYFRYLGIPTFTGSSGRVFPEQGIKPIQVLNSLLSELEDEKVNIKTEMKWVGWNENGGLKFANGDEIDTDLKIFALGGGSWKVTGSDGKWKDLFIQKEVKILPFRASNCGFKVDWPAEFIETNEGQPLKNIAIFTDNSYRKGEVIIAKYGLEGNAIYAHSQEIQNTLAQEGVCKVLVDLKPMFDLPTLHDKYSKSKFTKTTDIIKNSIGLSKTQIRLLKAHLSKEAFLDVSLLLKSIKALPLILNGSAPIDEAISTLGGIDLAEINEEYELIKLPKNYVIGEMLDWNAPTGGYLLQACFSMGVHLARSLNKK